MANDARARREIGHNQRSNRSENFGIELRHLRNEIILFPPPSYEECFKDESLPSYEESQSDRVRTVALT